MNLPTTYATRRAAIDTHHQKLLVRPNVRVGPGNGIFDRFVHPVLTAEHVPLTWRYDYSPQDNPLFLERLGINSVFNAGALYRDGKYLVLARVEGWDRKSFFAFAESETGVDGFRFWGNPVALPEVGVPATNMYDARVTEHEDGYVYLTFCVERRDPAAAPSDTSSAVASAAIARSRDLTTWERLPNLVTPSPQQRNVVVHPRFVRGQYLLYTRPQDGFIETGAGGGIAWGLCESLERPVLEYESVLDPRVYHTIKESKNGAGAPPVETSEGWLHVAHGVRATAAGLRYVLYAFLCALDEPTRVIRAPGGYLMAPEGEERVGDVSNVLFCNGVAVGPQGRLLIYYGSSDTRLHVAETSIERMLDYVTNTPGDSGTSGGAVAQRLALIRKNQGSL